MQPTTPTIRQTRKSNGTRALGIAARVAAGALVVARSCPAAYKETGCTCQAANLSRRVLQRADRHNSPLAPGPTSLARPALHQRNRRPNYRSRTRPKLSPGDLLLHLLG
jgi:hypothetical protein